MDTEPEADPDSEKALLDKKQRREVRKINAAREKTQKRFEALLSIGSGSEDVPERKAVVKKRERAKTADVALRKSKQTPPKLKARSRSEENLLSVQDNAKVGSSSGRSKQKKSKDKADNTDAAATSSVDKPKKKKKKAKPKPAETGVDSNEEQTGDVHDGSLLQHYDGEQQQYDGDQQYDGEYQPQETGENRQNVKKEKRKRPKKREGQLSKRIELALEKKRYDDGLLLCIIIHKADQVKPDARIRHPLIRVHLVNMETGDYIKKIDSARNVTSMFEKKNENESIDYILPLLTQPYDFKTNRTLTPYWEETLVYNEVYSYFLQREVGDPPVIIFFELLDFMQMNLNMKEFEKTDKGWYRIAWAFLKVVSPCGGTNTDRQVRLQFYQPLRRVRAQKDDNSSIEIFRWWKYGSRIKYPSTLYVTVKGVFPPERLEATTRSMFPTQKERGAISYEELNSTIEEPSGQSDYDMAAPMWTRVPGQLNRIPNKLELSLPSGRKGCSVVQFSNNGRYLACACASNDGYPILIYEFPEGKLVSTFSNHFGIVYDLCWSSNGKELLSASADSTVRCWDTKRFSSAAIKLFPHPSYVYTCKYHVQAQSIVVTGCYDHVIRVWSKMSDTLQAILLRELSEHNGFVNSFAFSIDGGRFFSADSVGIILEWSCPSEKKKKADVGEMVNRWQLVKTIQLKELENATINTLHVHPGECKLLIHTRDSMLRMLDLRSYGIVKSYSGGMNFKEHLHSALSVCGSFVFCGTEYGQVHVWSTESGHLVHTYKELEFSKSVSHVHFHPQDNFVVFCCYGDAHPILVYSYDAKANVDKRNESSLQTLQSAVALQTTTTTPFDGTMESFRSLNTAAMISQSEERLTQINEKLMSVTAQSTRNRVTFKDLTPRSDTMMDADETSLSTWGSDFTYTPTASPSLRLSSKIRDNLSSTPKVLQESKSDGRHDAPMTLSELEGPSKREDRANKSPRKLKTVLAMYDFHPTQPNQLAFNANDIITVIGKGNADWHFGQLADGRQGYVPVTYVMQAGDHEDSGGTTKSSKSEGDVSTTYSAVVDKHGELKFISGNEDSDSQMDASRRSHKKRSERRSRMEHTRDNPTA